MNLLHLLKFACLVVAVSAQGQQMACGKADILLILDTPSSVMHDYPTEKNFASNLTSGFQIGPNAVQFAALIFGTTLNHVFNFTAYQNSRSLYAAVQALPYIGTGTETGKALRAARLYSFTAANGARPNVTKVAVVITDGQSQDSLNTSGEASKLKQSGITVFAVGVGDSVDQDELKAIASSSQHLFNASSFEILDSISEEIQSDICKEIMSYNLPLMNGSYNAISCLDREDGNYYAPYPECKQGYYYRCVNENGQQKSCPLGIYKDSNDRWFFAKMVYNGRTDNCELESPSCPRNPHDYLEDYEDTPMANTPCQQTEVVFLLDMSENAKAAFSINNNSYGILQDAIRSFLTNPRIAKSTNSFRIGAFGYSSSVGNKEIIPIGSTPQYALSRVINIRTSSPAGSWTYKGLEQITIAPFYCNNLLVVISSQGSGTNYRRTLAETETDRVIELGWKPYVIAVQGRNKLDIVELTLVNNGTVPVVLRFNFQSSNYLLLYREFINIINNMCNASDRLYKSSSATTLTTTSMDTSTEVPKKKHDCPNMDIIISIGATTAAVFVGNVIFMIIRSRPKPKRIEPESQRHSTSEDKEYSDEQGRNISEVHVNEMAL